MTPGALWTHAGYRSGSVRLEAVALTYPPDSLGAIRGQFDDLVGTLRQKSVDIDFICLPRDGSPNAIFVRDLLLMTRAARWSAQRAGEERHATRALAAAGYPILRTVSGDGTFEGADALWIDDRTVVVGTGFRTNRAGAAEVRSALSIQDADVLEVPLLPGVQHLLGCLMIVDHRVAAVHATATADHLRHLLRLRGYRLIEIPPGPELLRRRGMNMLTLEPGRVLIPTGAPTIRRALADVGVESEEVDVGGYTRAAGALGCTVGTVRRAH